MEEKARLKLELWLGSAGRRWGTGASDGWDRPAADQGTGGALCCCDAGGYRREWSFALGGGVLGLRDDSG